MQMVSDIAGIAQVVPSRQIGASYGDAFLAAVGVGAFSGVQEISRWVRPERVIEPRGDVNLVYQDFYRVYRALYDQNVALLHELARLGR
jgi:xylulokinase